MKTKAEQTLKRIAAAITRLEKNAQQMLKSGLDHSHWSGRLDGIRDIKDVLLEAESEGEEDGDAANSAARS